MINRKPCSNKDCDNLAGFSVYREIEAGQEAYRVFLCNDCMIKSKADPDYFKKLYSQKTNIVKKPKISNPKKEVTFVPDNVEDYSKAVKEYFVKHFGDSTPEYIIESLIPPPRFEDLLCNLDEALPPNALEKRCLHCNITFEDFVKFEKLGCPQCWLSFSNEIVSFVDYIEHRPRDLDKLEESYENLFMISKELDQAVENKEFMKAAKLRDEIMIIKKVINDLEYKNENVNNKDESVQDSEAS